MRWNFCWFFIGIHNLLGEGLWDIKVVTYIFFRGFGSSVGKGVRLYNLHSCDCWFECTKILKLLILNNCVSNNSLVYIRMDCWVVWNTIQWERYCIDHTLSTFLELKRSYREKSFQILSINNIRTVFINIWKLLLCGIWKVRGFSSLSSFRKSRGSKGNKNKPNTLGFSSLRESNRRSRGFFLLIKILEISWKISKIY